MAENNCWIRLYPENSDLSNISDLIIQQESKLLFEVRDAVLNDKEYTLSIDKGNNIIEKKVAINDCNKFEIVLENDIETQILSRTSKEPFKAELKKSSKIIAKGLFYRYRKKPKNLSQENWDTNYNPERHKNYKKNSENVGNTSRSSWCNKIEKNESKLTDISTELKINDQKNMCDNNEEFFDSFLLRFDCDTEKIDLEKKEKLKIYNRAVRILKQEFKVDKIAHFKLILEKKSKDKDNKNEIKECIRKLLKDGIKVKIDEKIEYYCYIGSSNSGRRESNFWAVEKKNFDKLNLKNFLNYFGDFCKFKQIQKLNKRYSLLYTTSKPFMKIKRTEYKIIEDVKENNFCFTDGIGIIRKKFCEEISKSLNLEYTSYVFQIRMGGFKGVLTAFSDEIFDLNCPKDLNDRDNVKILFRKSQEKFDSHDFELNIVSWAINVTPPANLNSEIIMVLDGIANGNEVRNYFIKLFEDHFSEMEKCFTDPKKALAKFANTDTLNEFTHKYKMILLACRKDLIQELDPKQYKIISDILIEQNLYKIITKRNINIQLEKSAYFIGVIDETGELEEDEVYVAFYNRLQNIEYLDGINVAICKMPCYSVTEIRKVRTKKVDKLSHLVNCVVFSKKGTRPLTNILSGGDLDGDLYFVTWNDHLTNFENSKKEFFYPEDKSEDSNKQKIDINKIDHLHKELINVFVDQVLDENSLGLWHYALVCLYDRNRKNMLDKKYLNCVTEINKCIDGIKSDEKNQFEIPPSWYIADKDIKNSSSNSLAEKIDELKTLLEKKKIKDIDQDSSLLAILITRAVEKFNVIEKKRHQNHNGEFLTKEEIIILEKHNLIFDSSSRQIDIKILNQIEQEYKSFTTKILKLNSNSETSNKNMEKFKGMLEKQLEKKVCSEKEITKALYCSEFRNFVLNISYFDQDISDKNLIKSVYSLDGIYFRSRVVGLYEEFKNDEHKYQIPWMFYDVLCYMKNFCNDKLSEKASNVLPNLIPFSLSAENTAIFSTNKLNNFNSIN